MSEVTSFGSPNPDRINLREELDRDVKAFLAGGGKVDRIPIGVTTIDYAKPKGKVHIVLAKADKSKPLMRLDKVKGLRGLRT